MSRERKKPAADHSGRASHIREIVQRVLAPSVLLIVRPPPWRIIDRRVMWCRIIERRIIRTWTVGASGWTRLGAGAGVAAETVPADIRMAPKAAAAIAEAVRRVVVIGADSLLQHQNGASA